jgi:hypothetical protein
MSVSAIIIDKSARRVALAETLRDILERNLEEHSDKSRLFRFLKAAVCVHTTDSDEKLTMYFNRGSCVIFSGLIGKPDLHFETTEEQLLGFSNLNLIMGLPSLVDGSGRELAKKLVSGEVRVRGMFRHPLTVAFLGNIFSVNKSLPPGLSSNDKA